MFCLLFMTATDMVSRMNISGHFVTNLLIVAAVLHVIGRCDAHIFNLSTTSDSY
jgi:Flp pilus assembly protein protease CpaA